MNMCSFSVYLFCLVKENSLRDTTQHYAVHIKEKRQDFIVIFTQLHLKSMPYKINTAFLCVFAIKPTPHCISNLNRSKAVKMCTQWHIHVRLSHQVSINRMVLVSLSFS